MYIHLLHCRLEGQVLSQMLRKSIETRDWLNNVEPRSVRAVMKRVVEETTSIGKNHSENTFYEPHSCSSRQSTKCSWRMDMGAHGDQSLNFWS